MIKYYYKSLRAVGLEELAESRRGAWVHVEAPSEEELAEIQATFKLDAGLLEDALDEDEQPRLEKEDGITYVYVRFAYRKVNGDFDTAPLLLIPMAENLVTITPRALPVLGQFIGGRKSFATTQKAKLLLQILSSISDQYDVFISQTTRRIKGVRGRLKGHGITNQDFLDFVTIEDELNEFLSALQPNNATLRRLLAGRHLPLHEEDQDLVEDLLLSNEQSIEGSRANLKSITNIRDAYTAISSNNLNRTIEILTMITVAVQIPNLFYAMFGMNVHVPWQNEVRGFWVAIIISLVPLILLWVIAKKRRIL